MFLSSLDAQMIYPFAMVLLVVPALFAAFAAFDRLVRLEHSEYRANWEADGRPTGFVWQPDKREGAFDWTGFARNRCSFCWLWTTPEWMRTSPEAMKLVSRLRTSTAVWNVGVIVSVVAHLLLNPAGPAK